MEITDLMIGDWVNFKGSPYRISRIESGLGIEKIELYEQSMNKIKPLTANYHRLSELITPIPISKEILEKNDYKLINTEVNDDTGEKWYEYLIKCSFIIRLYEYKDCISASVYSSIDGSYNLVGTCDFIHELQHILKLLPVYHLNKEIIL